MDKKTILILVISIIVAFALGFGGIWFLLSGNQSHEAKKENVEKESKKDQEKAALTSTVDLFQLALPCKRNAEGDTPIVHADFQLVVPIKHRMKIEENTSRVRDIIATLLRNSDINEINSDNLVGFKKQIIRQSKETLGVEIEEVLVLRFDYDILKQRH
jgi:flagellar basal body-associated protein FliL